MAYKKIISYCQFFLKKDYGGELVSYLSYGLLAKLLPILGLFFFTSLLTPEEFGGVAIFTTITMLSASFLNFGVSQMIVREKQMLDKKDFSSLIWSGRAVSIVIALLLFVVFYLVDKTNVVWPISFSLMTLSIVFSPVLSIIDVSMKTFVVSRDAKLFGRVEVFKTLATVGIPILLIIAFSENAFEMRIAGYCVGLLVAALVAFYLQRKYVDTLPIMMNHAKEVVVYGVKVFPQVAANWLKMGADKILLVPLLSLDALGAYSFTATLCSMVMILGNAVNNTYTPRSISYYKNGNLVQLRKYRFALVSVLVFCYVLAALGIVLSSKIYWPKGYELSVLGIFMFMFANLAQGVYLLYAKYFLFQLKMPLLAAMNLGASLVYVCTLYLMSGSMSLLSAACVLALYNGLLLCTVVIYVRFSEGRNRVVE
ncbi:hypothetical protein NBRC116494_25340 [Aurantivibrio plasticivorans]